MKKELKNKKRYSDLTLLKQSSKNLYPDAPEKAKLEVFKNIYSDRDYEIKFDCPEYSSLCPVTNQPDYGKITITYVPDKLCIESKSLKLFLFSFRNHNTFHEEAVNSILDAIVEACSPRRAEVTGEFNARGGISISVRATSGSRPSN